jgi:hypothetical protein
MYKFATEHVENNNIEWCRICSYGIYIPWVHSACKDFFWALLKKDIPTFVIVGEAKSDTTRYRDNACLNYKNLDVVVVKDMHAKCILFSDRTFITGSVNISDSRYAEIAMSTRLSKDEMNKVLAFMVNLI